jgi:hypothetical protein
MVRIATTMLAAFVLLVPSNSKAESPNLKTLLALIAGHVAEFKAQFSLVVGVEHYDQVQREVDRRTGTRQLLSEVFFFRPESDGPAMTVRTVRQVDGHEVKTPTEQIEEALALPPALRTRKLRALADAGAQYNLGSLQRNFNEPTVALTFGAADYQPRFRFSLQDVEVVDGLSLQRLGYSETERPTIIRDGRSGGDVRASGRLWTTDAGVVMRTELHVEKGDVAATIRVAYRLDDRLRIMVPATMDEDYRFRDKDDRRLMFITAHASYSDYRRFETSARIVAP